MTVDMRLTGSFSGCFPKTFADPLFMYTKAYWLGHHVLDPFTIRNFVLAINL